MILHRLRRNGESGAVALIVAVLFSSLVFAGCAALTLDVGRIDSEREQLQNGADAVALSVAMDCANLTNCLAGDAAKRAALANGNAQDGKTNIARIDGGNAICGVGPGLPTCPALQDGLIDCVQPTSGTAPGTWVRVYTQTNTGSATQNTLLPYSFAAWLTGNRGIYPQACAQAGVRPGYDASKLLPLGESDCAWEASTTNGTAFAPLPAYSTAPTSDTNNSKAWPYVPTEIAPSNIVSLTVQGGGSAPPGTCGRSSSGAYTPGNFGWLDQAGDASTTCQGNLVGNTMTGNTGTPPSKGCFSVLPTLVGTIVYLPVFTSSTASGSTSTYTIKGAAAFYLAGVTFNGSSTKKAFNGYNPVLPPPAGTMAGCDPKDNTTNGCIWGWFVKPLVANGTFDPTGGTLGPVFVGLVG